MNGPEPEHPVVADAEEVAALLQSFFRERQAPFDKWCPPETVVASEHAEIFELYVWAYQLLTFFELLTARFGSELETRVRGHFLGWLGSMQETFDRILGSVAFEADSALPRELYIALVILLKSKGSPHYVEAAELDLERVAREVTVLQTDSLTLTFSACLAFGRAEALRTFVPLVRLLRLSDSPVDSPLPLVTEWSPLPGCFESHLKRRHHNPLFRPQANEVTILELDAARARDRIDALVLRSARVVLMQDISSGPDTAPLSDVLRFAKRALQLLDRADEIGITDDDTGSIISLLLDTLRQGSDPGVLAAATDLDSDLGRRSARTAQSRRFSAQLRRLEDINMVGPSVLSEDLPTLKAFIYDFPESAVEGFIAGLLEGAAFSMGVISHDEAAEAQLPEKIDFLRQMLDFVPWIKLACQPSGETTETPSDRTGSADVALQAEAVAEPLAVSEHDEEHRAGSQQQTTEESATAISSLTVTAEVPQVRVERTWSGVEKEFWRTSGVSPTSELGQVYQTLLRLAMVNAKTRKEFVDRLDQGAQVVRDVADALKRHWRDAPPDRIWYRPTELDVFIRPKEWTEPSPVDAEALDAATAKYLMAPWCQQNCLDWYILNGFVFDVFTKSRETLLQGSVPILVYVLAEGQPLKLIWLHWAYQVATWVGRWVAVPVAAVIAYIRISESVGFWLGCGYVAYVVVRLLLLPTRFVARRARKKALADLDANITRLGSVYANVRASVLHPGELRKQIELLNNEGVRFQPAVYAILDRAIQRDPAVFTVDKTVA